MYLREIKLNSLKRSYVWRAASVLLRDLGQGRTRQKAQVNHSGRRSAFALQHSTSRLWPGTDRGREREGERLRGCNERKEIKQDKHLAQIMQQDAELWLEERKIWVTDADV